MARTSPPAPKRSGARRRPVQERSQQTVERILDAAASLLTDVGLDGFTTNAIAARSGVSIAGVYGYFDDKYAILLELWERVEALRNDYLTIRFDELADAPDWRAWARRSIDGLVRFRLETPGANELRNVVVSVPDLRARAREADDARIRRLADALRAAASTLPDETARGIASAIVIANGPVLDRVCEGGVTDEALLTAYRDMVIAYLATVLD